MCILPISGHILLSASLGVMVALPAQEVCSLTLESREYIVTWQRGIKAADEIT